MKVYFDENISPHLAKGLHILEQPNNQGFEIYSIKEIFGSGIEDEKWIPIVGKENSIVITQDINIQRKSNQRELYKKHGIGIFFVRPPSKKGYSYWEMVEYTISRWKEFKQIALITERPFAYRCSCRGKIEKI